MRPAAANLAFPQRPRSSSTAMSGFDVSCERLAISAHFDDVIQPSNPSSSRFSALIRRSDPGRPATASISPLPGPHGGSIRCLGARHPPASRRVGSHRAVGRHAGFREALRGGRHLASVATSMVRGPRPPCADRVPATGSRPVGRISRPGSWACSECRPRAGARFPGGADFRLHVSKDVRHGAGGPEGDRCDTRQIRRWRRDGMPWNRTALLCPSRPGGVGPAVSFAGRPQSPDR